MSCRFGWFGFFPFTLVSMVNATYLFRKNAHLIGFRYLLMASKNSADPIYRKVSGNHMLQLTGQSSGG
ncbi:hypothetical protein Ancab_013084 [Ancistrocladus abbreviatus]